MNERRRWLRRRVRPEKTYSELDPVALEAAVNIAESRHGGPIRNVAISTAIREYQRVANRA